MRGVTDNLTPIALPNETDSVHLELEMILLCSFPVFVELECQPPGDLDMQVPVLLDAYHVQCIERFPLITYLRKRRAMFPELFQPVAFK
jgi:hypothetical protein